MNISGTYISSSQHFKNKKQMKMNKTLSFIHLQFKLCKMHTYTQTLNEAFSRFEAISQVFHKNIKIVKQQHRLCN